MNNKKNIVTGRVRAMRINNIVLPAYREFCKRNFNWLVIKFPIHNPSEDVPDELWMRRCLRHFRAEEVCGNGEMYPVTTWLVFLDEYIMGMIRIKHIEYDVDDCKDNLVSNVEFCVDGKFRGGNASTTICKIAIDLALDSFREDGIDDIVVIFPRGHKAMPRIMDVVFRSNKFFKGTPISGHDEDGNEVEGFRISKEGDAPFARKINAEEAKEIFG